MKRLNRFFKYFGKNKKAFFKYSSFSFIVGILELFGIALTYPFIMQLLNNPSETDIMHSPIVIGISIITLFLLKNLFMIYYLRLQTDFTKTIETELNTSFLKFFLISDYAESSKVTFAQKTNILGMLIPNVINNYILRLLNLNVNFFIFGLISLFLIIKFPVATLITLAFAVCIIAVQNHYFKPKLSSISRKKSDASVLFNQRTNEALLNIKSVKISNNEKFFFDNYSCAIQNFFKVDKDILFLNMLPPYIIEPFIIILLFVLLAVISYQNFTEPNKLIASFALIVSAIFRLSPTIARIQVNMNGINSALPIVDEFLAHCEEFNIDKCCEPKETNFYNFKECIELKDLSFEYQSGNAVLKNINLTINKGEFVGIAGLSGVGKTTLVDIISGLLKYSSGSFIVDGSDKKRILKIGYIPQEYSLINGSIKDNVVFGSKECDDIKVIDALKKAQLYDFIQANFKDGIEANPFVDSNGFSQGQKQRLAIARAIYSNPDILILDEATSSLDLKTEDEICNVLNSLKGEKTIIAIAHRLSTIKSADKIVFMENGMISDIAPFNELVNKNSSFKELVKLSAIK